MFKKNKVILLAMLIILAFVGYRFMFKKDPSSGNSDLATDSGAETLGQSAIGKDLIVTISKLKSLTLDDSFFKDPIFNSLNDFSIPLASQEVGRANPFSPIGGLGNTDNSGVSSSDKKSKN